MPFSPEEIEKKDFLLTLRGYDKEEVRAFLEAVASDYEALSEAARKDVPEEAYEEIGREIGSVMQAAKESAIQMKRQAEADATEFRVRAEKEATRIRDAATNASKRLHDEADGYSTEVRAKAEGYATELHAKADRYSTEVRAKAEKEAADKIRDSRNRLEQLQATEAKVRQRLYSLEAAIKNLRQELDANDATGGREVIALKDEDEDEEESGRKVTPAGLGDNNSPGRRTQASTKANN